MDAGHDTRFRELLAWLEAGSLGSAQVQPAASDASFRRYFRLRLLDGSTRIVMDAPPDREDITPWLHVVRLLEAAGLHVPKVEKADPARGFVMMEDLGTESYARVHALGDSRWEPCVNKALDALLVMQERVPSTGLADYDERRLREEIDLFPLWLLGRHLGLDPDLGRALLAPLATELVHEALNTPTAFTHRDYHSRNLLACPRPPGVIDFQDAVRGPVTYDLVSLLKDCYIDWPRERQLHWVERYYARAPASVRNTLPFPLFVRRFDLMGVQRHLKAAGIFARLFWRDRKIGYLDSIPRTLNYILEVADLYTFLEPLALLLEDGVIPRLEDARKRAVESGAWTP